MFCHPDLKDFGKSILPSFFTREIAKTLGRAMVRIGMNGSCT